MADEDIIICRCEEITLKEINQTMIITIVPLVK